MQPEELDNLPGFVNTRGGYSLKQALASVGPGWADLVKAFMQACEDANVDVVQVKEKFGGLRMYTAASPGYIFDLVEEIENRSLKTCEACGKPGKPRSGGWIKTLCDECNEEG